MDRLDADVVDIGPPADWVKVNVQKTVSLCKTFFNSRKYSFAEFFKDLFIIM